MEIKITITARLGKERALLIDASKIEIFGSEVIKVNNVASCMKQLVQRFVRFDDNYMYRPVYTFTIFGYDAATIRHDL